MFDGLLPSTLLPLVAHNSNYRYSRGAVSRTGILDLALPGRDLPIAHCVFQQVVLDQTRTLAAELMAERGLLSSYAIPGGSLIYFRARSKG